MVVAEGFLLLANPETLDRFDIVFFLEAPAEVYLARRLAAAHPLLKDLMLPTSSL